MSRSIAWRGERRCLTCRTHCPYQAIDEKNALPGDGGPSGPVVDKDLCTGCGKCEFVCPMETVAAIRVQSHGERRVATGPFISDARRVDLIGRESHLRAKELLLRAKENYLRKKEEDLRARLPAPQQQGAEPPSFFSMFHNQLYPPLLHHLQM